MKRCPTCQSIYTDDSLVYCLQDGTPLSVVTDTSSSAETTWQMSAGRELPPTEILKPEDMPTARIESAPATKEQQRARPTAVQGEQPTAVTVVSRGSNRPVIALSIIVALLLLCLGGLITWMMMRSSNVESGGRQSSLSNTTSSSNQEETKQSNTVRSNSNAGANVNATPLPSPVDVAAAQKEVQALLNGWAESIRQRNLDEHMKYYADVLDVYYSATNVNRERVRADRAAAFSKYSSLDMQLTNIKIAVDSSGTRATATFDKTFDFHGEKDFSGSGLNRFTLVKAGGRWRITGEKDLQTYYINK